MQNNVGIYASQISGHLWAPNGAYDALATVTVPSGGATSVVFSGIPQGYKHLEIRMLAKSNRSDSAYTDLTVKVNNNTGNNCMSHALYGNGSSASSYSLGSQPNMFFGRTGANNASGQFGAGILNILNYTSNDKYKTLRWLGGTDANGSGEIYLSSGSDYTNTNPITSIELTAYSATGWIQHSSFALYGVK